MISANMAKIQLNGKKITIKQRTTVLELLKNYKIDQKKIAMPAKRYALF